VTQEQKIIRPSSVLELAKQHGNVCRFEAICCCPIWSKARFWIETAGSA